MSILQCPNLPLQGSLSIRGCSVLGLVDRRRESEEEAAGKQAESIGYGNSSIFGDGTGFVSGMFLLCAP